jgi:hypothetical protein
VVAARDQRLRKMRADKTRDAGDEVGCQENQV